MSQKTRCPNCGLTITLDDVHHTFESTQRFNTAGHVPYPTHPPSTNNGHDSVSVSSHVAVPFWQSIIPGFFLSPIGAIIGMGLAYIVADMKGKEMTTGGVLLMAVSGALFTVFSVGFYQWTFCRLPFFDALTYRAEEFFQMDINQDNEVGEPKKTTIELTRNGVPHKIEDFAIQKSKLIRLARAVKEGDSFSTRTAATCGISREDFENLRGKLVSREWATWVNPDAPTLGVKLTDEGEGWIVQLASTPLPRQYR